MTTVHRLHNIALTVNLKLSCSNSQWIVFVSEVLEGRERGAADTYAQRKLGIIDNEAEAHFLSGAQSTLKIQR